MFLSFVYFLLAVHSSGAIRSDSTLDSNEVCGSVSCNKIKAVYDKPISKGVNLISIIPIGASEIEVSEIEPSPNVLSLKTIDNTYIINGQANSNTPPGIYNYFNDQFSYIIENNLETIASKGPLNSAFDLMLQGNFTNKGIKYSYNLPTPSASMNSSEERDYEWNEYGVSVNNDKLKQQKRKRKFNWLLVGFGPCNKSCGPGFRAPIFRCMREYSNNYNNKHYTPKRCSSIEKPVFNEQIYKCNLKKCTPYWQVEEWGKCLCVNGKGISSRAVDCVQENSIEGIEKVEASYCPEKEPHSQKFCECMTKQAQKVFPTISNIFSSAINTHIKKVDSNVTSGVWMTSNWSEKCEDSKQENCTIGIKHRTVVCDRKPPRTNLCDSNYIPSTFKYCVTNTVCSKGEWYASEWSNCIGDCFNLQKKRLIMCIKDKIVVSEENCDKTSKPEGLMKCNISDITFCGPRWHYSEWSECSKTCGEGLQKRVAKCYEIDEKLMVFKDSSNCRYKEREPTISSCNENKCVNDTPKINTSNEIYRVTEQISCSDEFSNCLFIDKSRLCALKYYTKKCCNTCLESN